MKTLRLTTDRAGERLDTFLARRVSGLSRSHVQKLISADAPENASLHSASLSLRGIFPWWVAVLVVIAIAAGVGFLYAREIPRFGPRRGCRAPP